MDDSQIIALYFQRKEQAISATAIKFGSYCMSVAANILRDRRDAEEAVSDAWMDAWNTIPPTRPKSLRAFLATLTRRRALDRYDMLSAEKRGGGQVALALEELAECASPQDVQAQAEASELAERIVEYRTVHGGFSTAEELMEVSGIGEKTFAGLKERITVNGGTAP